MGCGRFITAEEASVIPAGKSNILEKVTNGLLEPSAPKCRIETGAGMERTMTATQARTEWLIQHMGKCAVAQGTMVAAFQREEDRRDLERIVGPCEWKLIWTQTCAGAVEAVQRSAAPIIISGRTFPDGEWRDIWNRLRTRRKPPMFILASRLADEALWAEVLNLGGYNLLLKPFRPEEVIRTVHGALVAWQDAQAMRPRVLAAGESSAKSEV